MCGRTGILSHADTVTAIVVAGSAGTHFHTGAITAIACPTTNSYKRMEPYGRMREMSWAPVYRAYGHNNRTLIARLPMNRRCLEVRQVDSACNFYLATALVLATASAKRSGWPNRNSIRTKTFTAHNSEMPRTGPRSAS